MGEARSTPARKISTKIIKVHLQAQRFCILIRSLFPDHFKFKTVVDVGSADVAGNNRYLFDFCHYTGVDVWKGPNVDYVLDGPPQILANVYISTECYEHNPDWKATLENMVSYCNDMVLITCASTGRPIHGTRDTTPPGSPFQKIYYYKNLTREDIEPLIKGRFKRYWFFTAPQDLYFIGFKSEPKFSPSILTYLRLYFYVFYLTRIRDFKNWFNKYAGFYNNRKLRG